MATGTLLSGWRIKLTDSANSPLVPGRVRFYDSSTSAPKAVYADKDLTISLGYEVLSDLEGYLPAIWLSSGFHKAMVAVKTQDDPETWDPLWTLPHVGLAGGVAGEAGSGTIKMCRNMAELRSLASGAADTVIVLGYYTPGDTGDVMNFLWDVSSVRTDDAGAYILPSSQPAGVAGRWIQIFGDELDIRKWGGVPTGTIDCIGAYINANSYACDQTHDKYGQVVCLPSGGLDTYAFSGSVSFNAYFTESGNSTVHYIKYRIGKSVKFAGLSSAVTFTFINPIVIESDECLTFSDNILTFLPGSVDRVRPEWYSKGMSDIGRVQRALDTGIPVELRSNFGIYQDSTWVGKGLHFTAGSSVTVSSGITLNINAPVTSEPRGAHIFPGAGTVRLNRDTPKVRAEWFGWGDQPTNDQGPALRKALQATSVYASNIVIPLTSMSHTIQSDCTLTSGPTRTLELEGYLIIDAGGSVNRVSISAEYSRECLVNNGTLSVMNESISPGWFGARPDNYMGNKYSLGQAFTTAMQSHCKVDGGGLVYQVSGSFGTTTLPTGSMLHVCNMSLNPQITHSSTFATFIGLGDLILDNVKFNPNHKNSGSCVSINTATAAVSNCSFFRDVIIDAPWYTFDRCSVVGNSTGSRFLSALNAGVVSSSVFVDNLVYLVGTGYTPVSRFHPMLENLSVTHNVFQVTALDTPYLGCLYLAAAASDTFVQGVHIEGNTFHGHIDAPYGSGESLRIGDSIGNGTWLNDINLYHNLVIRNNVLAYKGWSGYETNMVRNIVPQTSGSVRCNVNIHNAGGYIPKVFTADLSKFAGVFTLTGNNQYFGRVTDSLGATYPITSANESLIGAAAPVDLPRANIVSVHQLAWSGKQYTNVSAFTTVFTDFQIYEGTP